MIIRPAAPPDAEGIAVVHVESWRVAYRGLLPQHLLDALSVEERALAWRERLAAREGQTLVAVGSETGRIVGFINVGPSRDEDGAGTGELRAIYLLADWWNTGTGQQLHDAGVSALAQMFRVATLWVLDRNDRARVFYERNDWYLDGRTKDDHRGDMVLSEVRYRRALNVE